MNNIEFNLLVETRLNKCKKTLCLKAEEYATEDNRLHNFEEAAKLKKTTMSDCALSFGLKHLVSIIDITRALTIGNGIVSKSLLDEKFGDAINYLLLTEACISQEMKEKGVWK